MKPSDFWFGGFLFLCTVPAQHWSQCSTACGCKTFTCTSAALACCVYRRRKTLDLGFSAVLFLTFFNILLTKKIW